MAASRAKLSLSIRPIKKEDLPRAKEILDAGYGEAPGREHELQRLLRIQSEGWFFACRGKETVGMGGAIRYDSFAYIGMMAVLPAFQRQGYGRALFEHILDWLREQGCLTCLLDATPAGANLYRQYHFVELDQARQYVCKQPPGGFRPSPRVDLVNERDVADVLAFDRKLFGADRDDFCGYIWRISASAFWSNAIPWEAFVGSCLPSHSVRAHGWRARLRMQPTCSKQLSPSPLRVISM